MSYFIKRLGIGFVTLWLVATVCFTLTKLAGEEAAFGEKNPPPEVRAEIMHKWGMDRPIYEQYFMHMGKLLKLDSMESRKQKGQTLRDILGVYFPSSCRLGARALILALSFGIPIGVLCAVYHNRWMDNLGTLFALTGVSVPSFILSSFAVYFLSRKFGWLPATGWDRPVMTERQLAQVPGFIRGVATELSRTRLWIPAACLGAFPFAAILRLTRSSMLDALNQDYVRTARAKGLSSFRVIVRHALRNALTPVVTYLGPVTAGVLTGSLVVEKIFAIPGLGKFFIDSVSNRDVPLIMGLTVFYSALLISMNLFVDAIYPILNPRLRKG